jgi:hypothetical protein
MVQLLIFSFRQVNKSVGRGLASALEKGEEATEKTKETVGQFSDPISHDTTYFMVCLKPGQNERLIKWQRRWATLPRKRKTR